jgi:hypothetical protein
MMAASVLFTACDLGSSSSSSPASTTDTSGTTDTAASAPDNSSSSNAGASTSNNLTQSQSTGSATLVWSVPTNNTDGTMLTNLGGYKVYYGRDQSSLSEVVDINHPGITSYVVDKLVSGTYYFALSAYNAAGIESAMKMVGSKTIP